MQDKNAEISSVNYYEKVKELTLKQGWIKVSLVQRKFRLSYGYTLLLVDMLQHRGIVGPADSTGKRLVLTASLAKDKATQNWTSPLSTPLRAAFQASVDNYGSRRYLDRRFNPSVPDPPGLLTSPTSALGVAGCVWPLYWTCTRA